MPLQESWSIKSRSHVCSITEEAFQDEAIFYTAIFPDPEASGYVRKDFSELAWKELDKKKTPPFSYWKSIYKAPVKQEKSEVVTKESAEDLLGRLIEEDQTHTENARYILAVMLERQKLLKENDTKHTDGGIIRFYEHKKTGDVYIVRDPNIPLSDVEKVQSEVATLLDGETTKAEENVSIDSETSLVDKNSEKITE